MRITSVELHPSNSSNVIVLSFRDPSRSQRFNVRAIAGLDADDIVPRYYGGSGSSGKKYYNLQLGPRNVIARVQLNPQFGEEETYSSLRDELYKIISSSRTGLVELWFKDGNNVVATISGFVSKFENALFEKTPEVQITFNCQDSKLKSPTPVVLDVSGLDPAPFVITDNLSTAPHGFKFEIQFTAPLASFVMQDAVDDSWNFTVTPVGGFLTDDVLHFSSEYDNKYLYIVRAGVTIYLAEVIQPGSIWPILFPGDNLFDLNDSDMDWIAASYYPTYWGV